MSNLPEGWAETTLQSLGIFHCGQSPAATEVNKQGTGTPYVSGPDQWNGLRIIENKWTTDPKRTVPEGCIFITVKGAGIGTIFPGTCCAIGRDIYAFQPSPQVDSRFAFYAIQDTIDSVIRQASGLIPGLSRQHLESHQVMLPPLPEQRRIVAKLDALLARVNACRDRLDRIPKLLARFRQSVLAAACSGLLSAAWRARNGCTEQWREARAEEACESVQAGSTPAKSEFMQSRGIPYLKVYNIVAQKIDFVYRPQFVKQVTHRGALKRSILRPGDVLMNIVGPPLGKVAIVPDAYPEWNMNQALVLFRPGQQLLNEFLYFQLRSGRPYSQILSETRGSAGQSNISLSQCRSMMLVVPSLAEQQEIVNRVGQFLSLADRLEARVEQARTKVDSLTQSILAKAFRGELVPTEAELAAAEGRDFESASQLLDRIRSLHQPNASKRKATAAARR